jgi:hypothetical protein
LFYWYCPRPTKQALKNLFQINQTPKFPFHRQSAGRAQICFSIRRSSFIISPLTPRLRENPGRARFSP